MTVSKIQRKLLLAGIILLVIQIPWFFGAQILASKQMTKTTATVIRIEGIHTHCTGDRSSRRDFTCDHSQRLYPVYEYFDAQGHSYVQDDRYFGEYKQGNPLGRLFLKHVGDKVTAYYTHDKPQEVLFMASPYAYAAWLIPAYLATTLFVVLGIIPIARKLLQQSWFRGIFKS